MGRLLFAAGMLPILAATRLADWVMPDGGCATAAATSWSGEELSELGRVLEAIGEEMKPSGAAEMK
jgi:hypothetical protein